MHSAFKQKRLQEFEELCRRQALPLTVQRRTILDAVLATNDHPTAEQVFRAVQDRLPGVSRTTVYRVLDTLVRVSVIKRGLPALAFSRSLGVEDHVTRIGYQVLQRAADHVEVVGVGFDAISRSTRLVIEQREGVAVDGEVAGASSQGELLAVAQGRISEDELLAVGHALETLGHELGREVDALAVAPAAVGDEELLHPRRLVELHTDATEHLQRRIVDSLDIVTR